MMDKALILLVDDEQNIVQLSRLYLEREGYSVISAGDGKKAIELVRSKNPALMVLDLMLPEMDGLEVCKRLRADGHPIMILMLTAKDEDVDKILGLEIGADDYMVKPFNPRELAARVKALLRRHHSLPETDQKTIYLDELVIDRVSREVRVGTRKIDLRNQEFELLWSLAEHRSMVMSRDQLLNLAWGFNYAGHTRTVDVHIGNLRKKLGDTAVSIETVTGIGYKLTVSRPI